MSAVANDLESHPSTTNFDEECSSSPYGDQERFVADLPNQLPSSAQIRAFKTEVMGTSGTSGQGRQFCRNPYQGSGWTPQAALAQSMKLAQKPAESTVTIAAHGNPQPIALAPAAPRTGTALRVVSTAESRARSTELWYAQAAIVEARGKQQQLSFRPLRPKR